MLYEVITDAYVHVVDGQAYLEGFHIRHYSHTGPLLNHEPVRTRRLLLRRAELERLVGGTRSAPRATTPVSSRHAKHAFCRACICRSLASARSTTATGTTCVASTSSPSPPSIARGSAVVDRRGP